MSSRTFPTQRSIDLARRPLVRAAVAVALALGLAACGGGGGSGTAANPVASVELSPPSVLFTGANQERQLTASALDSNGQTLDANVIWSSSAPDQVSVNANGKLRSVTALGSAQIFAQVGSIRSAPVFVSTVETRPGTLLLRDAEILSVGAPINGVAGETPGLGTLYDVDIASSTLPVVGSLVLATETAQVAGRVAQAESVGNQVRIRVETIAAPELLARYDVNWVIDLGDFDNVMDGEPLIAKPLSTRVGGADGRKQALREVNVVPEWKVPKNGTSPLKCEGAAVAYFKSTPVEAKISGSPTLEVISSRLDDTLPPGRLRVALVGDLVMTTKLGLTAEAGLRGEVKCELKSWIPLPLLPPPIGPFVGPAIPVGIGVAVSGEATFASIDFSFEGKNGVRLELGVDCSGLTPCRSLDRAERINEFTPNLKLSSMQDDGLKIKLDASMYFLTGIDVMAFGSPFNVIDVKVGPKQSADFGSVKRQSGDAAYASNYDLKAQLEIAPGSSLKKAIEKLMGGEDRGSLGFAFTASLPLSESPNGTWQPDKTRAIPGRDTVNFRVDLKPSSTSYIVVGYNVKAVKLYRRLEGELLFSHFKTFPIAASNQSSFNLPWEPTSQDAGMNEFAVFVTTNLLPVIEPELEIMPDSIRKVEVACVSAAPAGAGRKNALAAGVCEDAFVGAFSGRLDIFPGTYHEISSANLRFTRKPGFVERRYAGSGTLHVRANTPGCDEAVYTATIDPGSELVVWDEGPLAGTYQLAVGTLAPATFQCGEPRQPVTGPYNASVTAGGSDICPALQVVDPFMLQGTWSCNVGEVSTSSANWSLTRGF